MTSGFWLASFELRFDPMCDLFNPKHKPQNPKPEFMKKLTRRRLADLPLESIHRARNWSKADVSVALWPPDSKRRVVIKTLKERPLWYRILVGRYFMWREWRALCVLQDVEGVPCPVSRPDSDTIVMEYHAGTPIEKISSWDLPDGVPKKIEDLVAAIHLRGVTHGDLHGYNVLVDDDGNIALIDWATASVFGEDPRFHKAFTFDEWQALDDRAMAKVKLLFAPADVSERQRELIAVGGSRIYRLVKQFKHLGEMIRGVDDKKLESRRKRQELFNKRLRKYDTQRAPEDLQRAVAKLEKKKQEKRRTPQKNTETVSAVAKDSGD